MFKMPLKVLVFVIPSLALCLFLVSRSAGLAGPPRSANNAPPPKSAELKDDSSRLKVVKPGSPEARYIAQLRASDKAAGRPPDLNLVGMAGPMAQGATPVPEYKGSHLQIDPHSRGEMRVFQERFAATASHQEWWLAAR
jgi:hypothetical protein